MFGEEILEIYSIIIIHHLMVITPEPEVEDYVYSTARMKSNVSTGIFGENQPNAVCLQRIYGSTYMHRKHSVPIVS